MTKVKRGLVIGCGGVAGAAWSIATLSRLEQELNWKAADADILIGTSSGAMLASLLSAGVSTHRMMKSQEINTDLAACIWDHNKHTGGAMPPIPKAKLSAPKLLWRGLQGKVSAITAVSGIVPSGSADMQPFVNLLDEVIPAGTWTKHPATWLVAVDGNTGQRVALGSNKSEHIPMNKAACASYAIPGWCPPVHHEGKTYLDGGIASPTSADFLINEDVDEVIVMAPMASSELDNPRSALNSFERRARKIMTKIVDSEIDQLKQAGKKVIRLEPGPKDLEAIGFNMMDPKRRERVFQTALKTAPETVQKALLRA